jgi:hypothetical protein
MYTYMPTLVLYDTCVQAMEADERNFHLFFIFLQLFFLIIFLPLYDTCVQAMEEDQRIFWRQQLSVAQAQLNSVQVFF